MLGAFPVVSGQRRDSTTDKWTSSLARASWRKKNHSATLAPTSLALGRKPKNLNKTHTNNVENTQTSQ